MSLANGKNKSSLVLFLVGLLLINPILSLLIPLLDIVDIESKKISTDA